MLHRRSTNCGFGAPRPVVPWEGIRDASKFGKIAPQLHNGQFRGAGPRILAGEDCLTINVLSTGSSSREPPGLPVMVFIHGGGYSAGSSQDFPGQGETFVQSGQVLYVSFNYRLGVFGYLDFSRYSTPERPFDSNLGLRDQVAALEWVHDNIAAFGGDPDNVTVFGESAGGNAVTTLLATPSARGLFARAIAQSPPADAVYPRDLADEWAAEFVTVLRTAMGLLPPPRGVPWQCASSRPRPPPSSRPPPSPFSSGVRMRTPAPSASPRWWTGFFFQNAPWTRSAPAVRNACR